MSSQLPAQLRLPVDEIHRRFQPRATQVGSDVEEGIESFQPRESASEREQNRSHSLALFGKGRLLFQRGNYALALAAYQRAWHWNADAEILRQIVPLAFELERPETAVAYAVLKSELAPENPDLMHQLAMSLAQEGQYERGIRLLDKAIVLQQKLIDAPPLADAAESEESGEPTTTLATALLMEMHFDRLRLCLLANQDDWCVSSAEFLQQALTKTAEFDSPDESIPDVIRDRAITYDLLAEIFLQTGRLDEATAAFVAAKASHQDDAIHAYHLARVAEKRKEYEQALAHLETYFRSKSDDAGEAPYELLSEIAKQKYSGEEALTRLRSQIEKLVNSDPANVPLAEFAGHRHLEAQDYAAARQALEPLLGDDPTVRTFRELLTVYRELQQPGAIVALLGQAVEMTGALDVFGSSLDGLLVDEAFVTKLLAEASQRKQNERRPMVASEAMAVGMLCLSAEKFDIADEYFQWAVDNTSDPAEAAELELDWAEACYFVDHLPPAIELFRKALAAPTETLNQEATAELLATALEIDGQTEAALKVANDFLKKNPGAAGVQLRKAWVLLHARRNSAAADAYQVVLDDHSEDYSSAVIREIVRDARMMLSTLQLENDELDTASELLQQVLDEFPEDVGAMNDLGYLWSDAGLHLYRSLDMIQKAVAAEPENPAYLDSLGWVNYRLGRVAAAIEPIEKAIALMDSPDGIILDHLGDVYLAAGRREAAAAEWQKALQSLREKEDPTSDDAELEKTIQAKLDQLDTVK